MLILPKRTATIATTATHQPRFTNVFTFCYLYFTIVHIILILYVFLVDFTKIFRIMHCAFRKIS